jgi:hypothetical protein
MQLKNNEGDRAFFERPVRQPTTRAAEAFLDGEGELLIRKAVELALAGDVIAMRLCLDRTMPPRRGRPVAITLPKVTDTADVTAAIANVIEAMADGRLTPDEAASVAAVIETQRRAIELSELVARVKTLEERVGVKAFRPELELEGERIPDDEPAIN